VSRATTLLATDTHHTGLTSGQLLAVLQKESVASRWAQYEARYCRPIMLYPKPHNDWT